MPLHLQRLRSCRANKVVLERGALIFGDLWCRLILGQARFSRVPQTLVVAMLMLTRNDCDDRISDP